MLDDHITEIMYDWYYELREQIGNEFQSCRKQQIDKVCKKDIQKLYFTYCKYLYLYEDIVVNILSQLQECLLILYINSNCINYGGLSDMMDNDNISEEVYEKYLDYIYDDDTKSCMFSDNLRIINDALSIAFARYETVYDKFIAVDKLCNIFHGRGRVSDWFFEGGSFTLDSILYYQPKGLCFHINK